MATLRNVVKCTHHKASMVKANENTDEPPSQLPVSDWVPGLGSAIMFAPVSGVPGEAEGAVLGPLVGGQQGALVQREVDGADVVVVVPLNGCSCRQFRCVTSVEVLQKIAQINSKEA